MGYKTNLLALALGMVASGMVAADPLPRGAQTPNAYALQSAYAGRTALWVEDCNGGIYYGPGGQVRAWCADKSESLGVGTWHADNYGRLCTDLTWYWPDGNRAGSSPGSYECIMHVEDRSGRLWRNWPPSHEWWPLKGDPNFVSGYRFQHNVLQTKRRLGI